MDSDSEIKYLFKVFNTEDWYEPIICQSCNTTVARTPKIGCQSCKAQIEQETAQKIFGDINKSTSTDPNLDEFYALPCEAYEQIRTKYGVK